MAHPHAENMRLYAEDAAETGTPWERWEFESAGKWIRLLHHPDWKFDNEYRRIPQPIKVEGWVNVWDDSSFEMYDTEEDARMNRDGDVVASKHISFEYTPGEGLE